VAAYWLCRPEDASPSHPSVTVRARSHGTNCAGHPLSLAREGTKTTVREVIGDIVRGDR
jgi:hypothetical protein